MQHYLVVSTLIESSSDIIRTFSKLSRTSGCSILECRFSVHGQELSVTMYLSGTWDAIAKMEDMLAKLSKEHDTPVISKRTRQTDLPGDAMPYAIDVVGADQHGIIDDMTDFMISNELTIRDMSSHTYQASQTGASMFSLHMTINIPLDASIAAIRGEFIDFCDRLNLDAIMEPVK